MRWKSCEVGTRLEEVSWKTSKQLYKQWVRTLPLVCSVSVCHAHNLLPSMGTLEELDRCCSRLTSGSSDESLAAARSLRNSCAGSEGNALHLIATNVIEWIAIHCREVALLKLGDQCGAGSSQSSSSIKHRQSFILALCQFLSNFAACGERPSHYLWSNAFGAPG